MEQHKLNAIQLRFNVRDEMGYETNATRFNWEFGWELLELECGRHLKHCCGDILSALNGIFASIMQHCSCHNPLLASFFSQCFPPFVSVSMSPVALAPGSDFYGLHRCVSLSLSVCVCVCQYIECAMLRKLISCNRSLYYKLFWESEPNQH